MMQNVALLMEKLLMELLGGDDSAKSRWKERVVLRFLCGIRIRCKWLQGDKYYRKMDPRNDKLDLHNGYGKDSCKRCKIFQQQRVDLVVHRLEQVVR